MPKQIHVYGKPGCSLCDEVDEALEALAERFDFEQHRHNILENQALFERYRYAVPVVVIDGIERLRLRFNSQELEAALTAAQVPLRE